MRGLTMNEQEFYSLYKKRKDKKQQDNTEARRQVEYLKDRRRIEFNEVWDEPEMK